MEFGTQGSHIICRKRKAVIPLYSARVIPRL